MKGTNLRTEPKHIVFLSQLLLLFGFCHSCKTSNPMVEVDQVGTEAVVTSTCSNPKCPNPKSTWHSQPTMPGTKLPAGNFLLGMAILEAWASASKVFTVFAHMGLGCISLNTFFKYQRVSSHENVTLCNIIRAPFLIPLLTILHHDLCTLCLYYLCIKTIRWGKCC